MGQPQPRFADWSLAVDMECGSRDWLLRDIFNTCQIINQHYVNNTLLPQQHRFEQQSMTQNVKTLKPRLHDTTGCQTGCTTGMTTGCIV